MAVRAISIFLVFASSKKEGVDGQMWEIDVPCQTWAARLVEHVPHHDGVVHVVHLPVDSVVTVGHEADVVLKHQGNLVVLHAGTHCRGSKMYPFD